MNKQTEQQKLAPKTSKTPTSFTSAGKLFKGKTGLSCSLLVLIVLAGLLVAGSSRQGENSRLAARSNVPGYTTVAASSRQGEDPRFDIPEELSAFIDNATEVCGDDDPWKAGCVGAVWTACEEARSYWLNFATGRSIFLSTSISDVREIPKDLICRAAYMAELGRLASVLADRYGDEFYVEEVRTDWSVRFGDFWRFRDQITYTPWEPLYIYGGFRSDVLTPGEIRPDRLGPLLYSRGQTFTVGRWLEKIQNWGFDAPSEFDLLSDKSVDAINSLLGNIVDLTKPYDSWPIDATSDPRTGRATRGALQGPTWDYIIFIGTRPNYYSPSRASEAARGVYEICLAAITEAKIGASGWEDEIDACQKASAPCAQSSDNADFLCSITPMLAEYEQSWQQLPSVCETPKLGISRSSLDECWNAINRICNSRSSLPFMGRIEFRRYLSIHHTTCLITNPRKALA